MKTPEELNVLKAEFETVNKKLAELSGEDLEQVSGGVSSSITIPTGDRKAYDILCPYHDIMNYYECNRPLKGNGCCACKNLADNGNIPVVVQKWY